jgi:Phosphorylase superfamily
VGVFNSARPDGRHYRRDWPVEPGLLALAQQAVSRVEWPESPPPIVTGPLASGDQVIASAQKKQWLFDSFGAEAVEMEAAAVAQVATLNQCRWLAIRAVSDSADATLDIDIARLITYDDAPDTLVDKVQNATQAAARLVTQPQQAEALWRLRQGLKLAARNAALATAAVIGSLP